METMSMPFLAVVLVLLGVMAVLLVRLAILTAPAAAPLTAPAHKPGEQFWMETYRTILGGLAQAGGIDVIMLAAKNARVARVMADAALEQYRARWLSADAETIRGPLELDAVTLYQRQGASPLETYDALRAPVQRRPEPPYDPLTDGPGAGGTSEPEKRS